MRLLGLSIPVLLVACSSASEAAPPADAAPAADAAPVAVDAAPDAAALSDAQIADIVEVANDGEQQEATGAENQSSSADVGAFADVAVMSHWNANTDLARWEQTAQVSPEASDLEQQVATSVRGELLSLGSLSGAAFDVAYARAEVKQDTEFVALFDGTILPDVHDPALKVIVQKTRGSFATDLAGAQALVTELEGGGADAGPDAHTGA